MLPDLARSDAHRPVAESPLVTALNDVERIVRWCTPSIVPGQPVVREVYRDDIGNSSHAFGNPVEHTGMFGEAASFAAALHGAEGALLCPHGSTGGNAILLRMVSLVHPGGLVLLNRNVHRSTINAALMFGLDVRFLPSPTYVEQFETVLPPQPHDVAAGLARHPDAVAVVITSPTYEGLGADTAAIAAIVHAHDPAALLLVDEAWGGHLRFSDDLPLDAMGAGADACTQSTHKHGGALQGTALVLFRERRIERSTMMAAFRQYTTTSPSFHLLASIDAATRSLAAVGEDVVATALCRAAELRHGLAASGIDVEVLGPEHVEGRPIDATKVTIDISAYDISGFVLGHRLEASGVIVEKAGLHTVTFLATFQLPPDAATAAIGALVEILGGCRSTRGRVVARVPSPFGTSDPDPVLSPGVVRAHAHAKGELVAFADAPGRIAAEVVELYPPGIPVVLEGYAVTADACQYLEAASRLGASVIGRDPELRTLRVLQEQTS